ncbi:MAG: hypothetical protein HGA42_12940, partial [Nostocales cyanobacterium W4_Combined_metabat2_030]|nr:hypothetical protein [Nostocales cyanobacterium W4_Combined_metabat2_030]
RDEGSPVEFVCWTATVACPVRSDDPGLDALYRAGVRTVQLNSLDSYIDCPTREQRAWVGDAVQLGCNRPYLKAMLVAGEQISAIQGGDLEKAYQATRLLHVF